MSLNRKRKKNIYYIAAWDSLKYQLQSLICGQHAIHGFHCIRLQDIGLQTMYQKEETNKRNRPMSPSNALETNKGSAVHLNYTSSSEVNRW